MPRKYHIANIIGVTLFLISFVSFSSDVAAKQETSRSADANPKDSTSTFEGTSGAVAETSKYSGPIVVGSDFFVKEGKKFLNLSGADIAVQPDYILKTADVLVVDIWGDLDLHYSLNINKDGSIVIPNVGRVDLQGLSFEQGKKKILNKLADTYGFYIDKNDPGAGKAHLDITLGKISGVKVYLSGEVVHPGVVMLNGANSSVIAAIAAGEGLKNTGSVRNIQITHTDNIKSVFDLYDFLFKGKLSPENKYLKDGDIVYVPPMKYKAYALGALTNPGTYEINSEETLASLIGIAGGFSSFSSGKIAISNASNDIYDKEKRKAERQEYFSKVENCKVGDNDIILAKEQLSQKPYSYIEITGKGARYNGKLRFENGLTIKDYINRAGGLYRDAYKTIILQSTNEDGATSFNALETFTDKDKNTRLLPGDKLIIEDSDTFYNSNFAFICGYFEHPQMMKITGNEKISDLVKIGNPKSTASIESASFTHNGKRIFFDLQKIIDNPSLGMNINVGMHDMLFVPKSEPYIEVSGGVLSPGFYPYSKGQTAKYYIDLAGGFSDNADKYNTILIEGTGHSINGYSWCLWFADPNVKNGTKIEVPVKG